MLSILFPLTGNIKFGNPLRQMLGSTWDTLTLCPLFHPSPFSARFPMAKTIARLNFCLTSFGQKMWLKLALPRQASRLLHCRPAEALRAPHGP